MTKERLLEKLDEAIKQCTNHSHEMAEQLDTPPAWMPAEPETPREWFYYWEGQADAYASALQALREVE